MTAAIEPSPPMSLPVHLTSFVGRRVELADVRELLARVRLVTLTGPGGAGKTRLAVHVATAEAHAYPDGAWWVDLSEVSAGDVVADAAATAVGVLVEPVRGAMASLTSHLARARALVCIDNAEHLLDDVAALTEAILRECPDVRVLVTSREPLGLAGEAVWRLPPLADDEAIALFLDRARLVRPGFAVDTAGEAAIRSITWHLDGIPLALELAAAWLRVLTPEQIEASLDDRFTLLVRGPRGAQRRQATLAGSIDWSHALLDPIDRVVFRRLAVFAGTIGLDAARAVISGPEVAVEDVLPSIARLVDKSLVLADEHDGEVRYRLLETIRAYAAARLVEARESGELSERHLRWAVDFVERTDERRRSDPDGWRRAVRAEYPNLRAALDRGLADEDPARARRLAAGLAWFWQLDRRGRDGIRFIRRAIDRAPDDRSRLQAGLLAGLAFVADTAEPLDIEYDAATRALELATEVGDESLRALCLNLAAVGAFYTDFDAAWELCEQAHAAALAGDNAFVLGGSRALQALILHLRDRHAEAVTLIDDEVRGHLRVHRGVLATVVAHQAQGALAGGDPSLALEHAEEALRLAEPLGDYLRVGMARATLAIVHASTGDLDRADDAIAPVVRLLDGTTESVFVPGVGRALGILCLRRDDPEAAAAWFARDAGSVDRGMPTYLAALALPGMGDAQAALGRRAEAATSYDQAADVARRLRMPGVLADALDGRARLDAADPDRLAQALDVAHVALADRAAHDLRGALPDSLDTIAEIGSLAQPSADDARLLAASDAARLRLGMPRGMHRRAAFEAAGDRLRTALGVAFESAWADGAALALDDAVAFARRMRGSRRRPTTGWGSLTPTELEVVRLVVDGLSNPDIGTRLFMSRGTVKTHLGHVFAKLDVANRTELARVATTRLQETG